MTAPVRLVFGALLVAGGLAAGPLAVRPASAQEIPAPAGPPAGLPAAAYEIVAVNVEGADAATQPLVVQTSGLRVGQRVSLPIDEAFADAVRRIYRLGLFSDVKVVADRVVGQGVFVLIRVVEEPRLASFTIEGVGSGERTDLTAQAPLLRGRAVRPSDVERTTQLIERYFRDKGFRRATVAVARTPAEDGRVALTFTVDKGERVEITDVRFVGNEAFSEGTLQRRLKNTPEDRWWRFWGRETFKQAEYEEDLAALVSFYNERGYYGARIVRDTVYYAESTPRGPGMVVEIELEEGPLYHVRSVEFEGNTVFTDDELRAALGVQPGDRYDASRLERNLYYTQEHTDIASLYTDRGYLRFNIVPTITEAPGDSLDFAFEISEGDIYEFGDVAIVGNTRTKEHVVRRTIRTIPGQTYSRAALERSVRELIQLNYFEQTSLGAGPSVRVNDEDQTVDLTYTLAEAGGDQLELSGGWGGSLGLQLQARVTFNNFSVQSLFDRSAWRPLPTGDGQQLSLGVTTSGTRYQNYSLSFTEPWFRGRQTPVGFALGYSNINYTNDKAGRLYGRVFYRQALKWPDDFFQTGTDLGYSRYDLAGETITGAYGLPEGISQELTVSQSLTRNSLDNPIFPSAGSRFGLTATAALPLPGFIQYLKTELTNDWYTPITGRFSFNVKTRFGYIGSLTGDDVRFQRYFVGGSPLEVQGSRRGIGTDLVFMRGYPAEAISPRQDGNPVGGRLLNKYAAELQLVAVQTPQLSLAPYLFADAANAWDGFDDYNPGQLYRSVGVGARIFLPILGLLDLNYGYALDSYVTPQGEVAQPQWRFQFSLGGQ